MKRKPRVQTVEKSFWFQDSVIPLLIADMKPRRCFPSGLRAYYTLAAIAAETDSDPGPEHDGVPFQTTVARIAEMSAFAHALVRARIADLARLGVIDPVDPPSDPKTPFTLRLRWVDDERGQS